MTVQADMKERDTTIQQFDPPSPLEVSVSQSSEENKMLQRHYT